MTDRSRVDEIMEGIMEGILDATPPLLTPGQRTRLGLIEWTQIRATVERVLAAQDDRIADLERENAEHERQIRLLCQELCGEDTGDQSLEYLRSKQSPEMADICIAIGLSVATLEREKGEITAAYHRANARGNGSD